MSLHAPHLTARLGIGRTIAPFSQHHRRANTLPAIRTILCLHMAHSSLDHRTHAAPHAQPPTESASTCLPSSNTATKALPWESALRVCSSINRTQSVTASPIAPTYLQQSQSIAGNRVSQHNMHPANPIALPPLFPHVLLSIYRFAIAYLAYYRHLHMPTARSRHYTRQNACSRCPISVSHAA